MNHLLLIGAGFSRNWGGFLAHEVFDYLIGQPEIRGDEYLRNALLQNRNSGGFENALAEVQCAYQNDRQRYGGALQGFQTAIGRMFTLMNDAFLQKQFEFQNFVGGLLREFLVRFDAIFSLNQDILLDHHYLGSQNIVLTAPNPHHWQGAQLPGMKRIQNLDYVGSPSWGRDTWVPLPDNKCAIQPNCQPCFKLHGSSNWRDAEGGQLMVIGGNKSAAIRSHHVLAWSFGRFRDYLARPNTKLMAIGYGFRDQHINEAIIEALEQHGTKLFVVDPLGIDLARHVNPSYGGMIYAPNELDDAFKKGFIGASTRPISTTFGGDEIERNKMMNFF